MSLPEQPESIGNLIAFVLSHGGRELTNEPTGSHGLISLVVEELQIEIRREYDLWSVDLGIAERPVAPASFWVEAAWGREEVPDEIRAESWTAALVEGLPEIVGELSTVSARVDAMVARYREMQARRLGRNPDSEG